MADTGRCGGYCLVWMLMAGVEDTGRYDQYWLDGGYWLVWLILAGMADTAWYGC